MANDEGMIPDKYEKYVLAILFACLFASISWLAPAAYLTTTPPADHVEIESVSINQTTNTTHNLTVRYDSREKYPIEAQITLYQEQNDSDVSMETWSTSSVIQEGQHETSLTLDVKEPLPAGTYFYEFKLRIHAGYNVEKTYVYTTDSFPVENSSESTMICCGLTPLAPD